MTSSSARKTGSDRGDYGFARVRDVAFDAVQSLWRKRKAEGMKQSELAAILNRDTGWVSKQLSGPGNWTLRTFGEFVEAMDGEAEISVCGRDEPLPLRTNFDAYSGYRAGPSLQFNPSTNLLIFDEDGPQSEVPPINIVPANL